MFLHFQVLHYSPLTFGSTFSGPNHPMNFRTKLTPNRAKIKVAWPKNVTKDCKRHLASVNKASEVCRALCCVLINCFVYSFNSLTWCAKMTPPPGDIPLGDYTPSRIGSGVGLQVSAIVLKNSPASWIG